MKVTNVETLSCDAGWRNYHFVKLTTDKGVIGWSEFDEGFGSPGVTSVIKLLAARLIGQQVGEHELFTHVPVFENGHMLVPDRPGWGTEPIEEAILAHPPKVTGGLVQYKQS